MVVRPSASTNMPPLEAPAQGDYPNRPEQEGMQPKMTPDQFYGLYPQLPGVQPPMGYAPYAPYPPAFQVGPRQYFAPHQQPDVPPGDITPTEGMLMCISTCCFCTICALAAVAVVISALAFILATTSTASTSNVTVVAPSAIPTQKLRAAYEGTASSLVKHPKIFTTEEESITRKVEVPDESVTPGNLSQSQPAAAVQESTTLSKARYRSQKTV